MTYGPTPQGFVIKPLTAIVSDFETQELSTIDPAMQTGAATPLGQMNYIYGGGLAECWEVLQTVYGMLGRAGAEGPALDNIGDITGDERQGPKPSTVSCNCTLTAANSPYAAGSLVANVNGDSTRQFSNLDDVIVSADGTVPVLFVSSVDGPVEATSGTLTVITAPVSGWSAVTNPLDATPGTLLETDADYIERQQEELAAGGGCTVDAVRANLLQVPGIVSVTVQENITDVVDVTRNFLPPHSLRCIVWDGTSGGTAVTNDTIAQAIWGQKPTGTTTYGGQFGTATDAAGNPQVVYFDRSTEEPVYMAFTVTLAPTALIATVAPLVKAAVVFLSLGFKPDGVTPLDPGVPGKLTPGETVYALVYRSVALSVAGVLDVPSLALDFTSSPVATANLPIGAASIAVLDTSRITVNGI